MYGLNRGDFNGFKFYPIKVPCMLILFEKVDKD